MGGGGTLEHRISKYQFDDPYFAKKLLESIYVDNVINGDKTKMKALNFYEESTACSAASGLYELIENLKHVRVISIPRYYFSEVMDEAESYSLHVFGDASKKAFSTIIYVVMKVHSAYHQD